MHTVTSAVVAMAAVLTAVSASNAQAKVQLIGADPVAGGVAEAGASVLNIAFSEGISSLMSGAAVTDGSGKAVEASSELSPNNSTTLRVTLKQPLKPGRYKVAWHVLAADDGSPNKGDYSFTVN